jgi:hypothetical protein
MWKIAITVTIAPPRTTIYYDSGQMAVLEMNLVTYNHITGSPIL